MISQLIHTNKCSCQFSTQSSPAHHHSALEAAKGLHASVFIAKGEDILAHVSVEHLWMS